MKLFGRKKKKDELETELDEELELDEEEKVNILELLKEKDEDDELEQYLTAEEKAELEEDKREEKKLYIRIGIIFASLIVIIIAGLGIFSYMTQDELLKTTKPLLEEYYSDKYGKNTKIETINYIPLNSEENSNIITATLSDGNHIICIDDTMFGDDANLSPIKEEYRQYLASLMPGAEILGNNSFISFKDYYIDYNMYYDYIEVLPNNYNFETLMNSDKMTITDTIIYQGIFNFDNIQILASHLSDDSVLYFIRQERGLPVNLTVIKNSVTYSFDIMASLELISGITYYELDRNYNDISVLSINDVNKNDLETQADENITSAYQITYETNGYRSSEEQLPTYYLVAFKNEKLTVNSKNSLKFFSTSRYSNLYSALEITEYPRLTYIESGGTTYLIGEEELLFATSTAKESFWCRFNLC